MKKFYRTTSKKQDDLAQQIFHAFHINGTLVTMGTNFFNDSGNCFFDYMLNDVTILKLWVNYTGKIITL